MAFRFSDGVVSPGGPVGQAASATRLSGRSAAPKESTRSSSAGQARCLSYPVGQASSLPRARAALAFTLIEVIGVLTVIALLAAAVIPNVLRRIDHAAWTRELSDLNAIAESYTQYVLRHKSVPGLTTWATNVASQMSLPVAAITKTPRGYARAFLIDPNLNINGAGLPYTQTTNGTTRPVNARVLLVSSIANALPIATSVPSSAEFNAIWDAPEGAKPATSAWASWAGKAEDLRIKKLNLEPLFYQLILVNHDSSSVGRFSIDTTNTMSVPTNGLGWNSYYLDGTVAGLHDASSLVQTRYLLKRSISFIFEAGAWRGAIQGGLGINPAALDFLSHATTFMNQAQNPGAPGATQFSVLLAVYTFMYDYTLWANECPHFNNHGNSGNSIPEYKMLNDQGQNSGNVDKFSSDLIK